MNFRETTQQDLDFVADHSISRGIQKRCPEQIDYCFTLEHEDNPLAIGGFRLINSTTAWCWIDLSDKAPSHLRATYRVIKEWIDVFTQEHGIRRLQAYVETDFKEAIRMVQHLGFQWESNMRNFMGDKDAFMYVKIL